ncbi:MAG: hypothetical protein QOF21_466, partial [Actinomycetota bacterium]
MTEAAESPSLSSLTRHIVEWLGRVVTPVVAGKWWALRVGLFSTVMSFLLQAPPLELERSPFKTVIAQGAHPFTPMNVDPSSHEGKLAFRLVPPLLARFGHLSPASYYLLQVVLGIATLSILAWLFHNLGYSRRVSFALVFALTFTYVGSVWFIDTHPYFDAIAASALVLAMAARQPVLVFLAASIALWTDERSILPVLVVALWHTHRRNRRGEIAVGIAIAGYLALRAYLGR